MCMYIYEMAGRQFYATLKILCIFNFLRFSLWKKFDLSLRHFMILGPGQKFIQCINKNIPYQTYPCVDFNYLLRLILEEKRVRIQHSLWSWSLTVYRQTLPTFTSFDHSWSTYLHKLHLYPDGAVLAWQRQKFLEETKQQCISTKYKYLLSECVGLTSNKRNYLNIQFYRILAWRKSCIKRIADCVILQKCRRAISALVFGASNRHNLCSFWYQSKLLMLIIMHV